MLIQLCCRFRIRNSTESGHAFGSICSHASKRQPDGPHSLRRSGASHIFVTNRTFERAQELATLFQGTPVEYTRFMGMLPEVDILLASSGTGAALRFGVRGSAEPAQPGVAVAADEALRRGWADAAEFLRWMLSDEPELVLKGNGREWWWQRDAEASTSR